jgi:hypothetical protein
MSGVRHPNARSPRHEVVVGTLSSGLGGRVEMVD